jgi:hypothetical protein
MSACGKKRNIFFLPLCAVYLCLTSGITSQLTPGQKEIKQLGAPSYPHNQSGALSRGVVYFGYHQDANRSLQYVDAIGRSAKKLSEFNYGLQISIITNAVISPQQLALLGISSIIHIEEEHVHPGRQWWTRILYLNATPYDYTLAIDSDRIVCDDISAVFAHLESYDILGVSAGILPALDNGVLAFKKGPKFNQLISTWMDYQMKIGQFGNDQPALGKAIDRLPLLVSGVLPPTWQAKFIPAQGQKWGAGTNASRTLVLHGSVKIVALDECPEIMVPAAKGPRVIALDVLQTPQYKCVYSQAECDAFLRGRCSHPELDWAFDFDVMPRAEYLMHYGY